jgi:hypothetical protein
MKKLFVILTAITSLGMLPSVSQAFCSPTGQVPRVFVAPGVGVSSFDVRTSTPGSTTFRCTTTDAKLVNAALSAQNSHQEVAAVCGAFFTFCGATVAGLSAGGNAVSLTVSPP